MVADTTRGRSTAGPGADDRRLLVEAMLSEPDPVRKLRAAAADGLLAAVIPEIAPSIGFDQASAWHALPLEEHVFSVVAGVCEDPAAPLELRLAALLHDIGKPAAAFLGTDGHWHYGGDDRAGIRSHEEIGADIAYSVMRSLGYPLGRRDRPEPSAAFVASLVRWHMPRAGRASDPGTMAIILSEPGACQLARLRRADAFAKVCGPSPRSCARLRAFAGAIGAGIVI